MDATSVWQLYVCTNHTYIDTLRRGKEQCTLSEKVPIPTLSTLGSYTTLALRETRHNHSSRMMSYYNNLFGHILSTRLAVYRCEIFCVSSNSCSALAAHKFFHSQIVAPETCLGKFNLSKSYLDAVYACTLQRLRVTWLPDNQCICLWVTGI